MNTDISPKTVARFWSHVDTSRDCWLWTGAHMTKGYGIFCMAHGVNRSAHRYAYELAYGPIPEGMCVCHQCDNPPCCNPDHLFLGTQAENLGDMTTKGRRTVGERNCLAKLTADTVREIRARAAAGPVKPCVLAREYGVSDTQIRHIITGKDWRHLLPDAHRVAPDGRPCVAVFDPAAEAAAYA